VVSNCVVAGNWASPPGGGGASGVTLIDCMLSGNTAGGGWNSSGGNSGGGAANCTLNNCTLSSNTARGWWIPQRTRGGGMGGGAANCTLNNCTLSGNTAEPNGRSGIGGGASGSTLNNCTVTGNSGGGVAGSTLHNCTVAGNSGGGAFAFGTPDSLLLSSTLYNCVLNANEGGSDGTFYNCTVVGNNGSLRGAAFNSIIYYNSGGNYRYPQPDLLEYWSMELNYCCTTPLPTNGVGNITGPPLFMDMAAGDLRLWEGSPCIDAGTNLVGFTVTITNPEIGEVSVLSYAHDATDILGNTRFIDGNGDGRVAWDIGAYEFDSFRPPRFAVHPQLTPDGWRLNIVGAAGQWARLQRSSNLQDWQDIWSGWMGPEGVQQVSDRASYDEGQPVMFYRVVVR
jgi:hypothetical protein